MLIPEKYKILVVDDDILLSQTIERFLRRQGYIVAIAHSGTDALKQVDILKPDLLIVDIRMPVMSGIDFLQDFRQSNLTTPVIITTGYPDMVSVIDSMHNGAQDYIIKPFQMSTLQTKILHIFEAAHEIYKTHFLTELIDYHAISMKLSASQCPEDVLDIAFESMLETVNADMGYIMLMTQKKDQLKIVRAKGITHSGLATSIDEIDEWTEAKWVFKNNQTLVVVNGQSEQAVGIPFCDDVLSRTFIAIPIRTGNQIIGLVAIHKDTTDYVQIKLDVSVLEIIATQVGTTLKNADLYTALNQEVANLRFIADYTELFLGNIEPVDVIKSFLDTIRTHFSIDFMGVLFIQKRFHTLYYWSSSQLTESTRSEILTNCVNNYNKSEPVPISASRIKWHEVDTIPDSDGTIEEFVTERVFPLSWGESQFSVLTLKWKKAPEILERDSQLLRSIINQTRIALANAKLYNNIKENYICTIKALAIAVDAKDTYTHGHSENVMCLSEAVARKMGLPETQVETIKAGGLLHDIGKIAIPGHILNKPGPLTYEEFNGVMKTHPTLGANIIHDVPFFHEICPIILYHHENFDGTGYPQGIKGEAIPIGARIIRVADAYEAMTSDRPYRSGIEKKEAVARLYAGKETDFDPAIVDTFIETLLESKELSPSDI